MKISAIIASYNRCASLERCLETLFEQDLPIEQYEIVVVVDGSSDGTSEMLNTFRARGNLVVVEQENQGQTAALNTGVDAAIGQIVLFLDDDLLCDRGLLSAHVAAHKEGTPLLVFGRMRGILGPSPSAAERWTSQNLDRYYERLERGSQPKWPDDAWSGPNTSTSRATFLQAGGYDEQLFPRRAEDVDLGLRLWKMGVSFRFNSLAITSHSWVKSNCQMWVDDESNGVSLVKLCRKHPEYRFHSGLFGAMTSPGWKRLALMAATRQPNIARTTLGALLVLVEKFARGKWAQKLGIRLFLAHQNVAILAGACREAGSWHQLSELFGRPLAVLLYHHVGQSTPGAKHLSLTVSPSKFLRHIRWLRWRGYTPITPTQWLTWCTTGGVFPKKPVLLTFDDAYEDITRHALPVLERFGFPSAVFVISGQLGGLTSWDGLPLMTIEQVRDWARRGVEIGGHTRTHPSLTSIPQETVIEEVGGARDDLLKAGLLPLSFAYPYGDFDDRVRMPVKEFFSVAFTCEEGLNDLGTDLSLLKRTMVQPGDTLLDIEFRAAYGKSPLNRVRSRLRLRSRLGKFLRALNLIPN